MSLHAITNARRRRRRRTMKLNQLNNKPGQLEWSILDNPPVLHPFFISSRYGIVRPPHYASIKRNYHRNPVIQRQGSTEELNHTRTPSCPEEGWEGGGGGVRRFDVDQQPDLYPHSFTLLQSVIIIIPSLDFRRSKPTTRWSRRRRWKCIYTVKTWFRRNSGIITGWAWGTR